MIKSRFVIPATVLALTGMLPAAPAFASASDPSWESVQVTGVGEVYGEPDLLTANFGVETTAPTVAAALDRADTAATRMRDALLRAGLTRTDLLTSSVDVNQARDNDGKATGYTVDQGITAEIRDLPKAGAILSATIAAGGDAARLNGVSFSIENDSALLATARSRAFADAKGKAEAYAKQAGRPLGRVVKVTESAPDLPAPGDQIRAVSSAMFPADSPVPIEPGRQRLSATVTVEWLFARTPAPKVAARG
ncbi:hypothetical protein ACWT_4605 [Actinoplanes sp. SE50]|uniref:SIMPL domain-containing protein n=1 Tax=unclassified Actinoplanes TaxID=2626549 RepID=UPI00023ED483|nr:MULTISPECIES: SIMPL domain-containing protein [unclassified Actinoplanes]AEV85627.1 hypothetical protein ACPL_4736 [Actinoplanes sp. SE50/110]ATO84020.1 hypothetical protein ACWT_4605 [Actinoplanes sp. SE50]SLM01430.1 hypothetical protein ACSP50_4666 [Actinoplanes sp. SE50/110]